MGGMCRSALSEERTSDLYGCIIYLFLRAAIFI